MKTTIFAAVSLLALIPVAIAQQHPTDHVMTTPADLKWADVGAMGGAKIAVLEGPLTEAVPFVIRLQFPAGTKVAPHYHSTIEHVTVLTGEIKMGAGDVLDPSKTKALEPGSISIMQPGMHHFVYADKDSIVQVHGVGPWTVTYVNPADDPRNKK
jgi:quercetin dioxygenase-like cupin family protein